MRNEEMGINADLNYFPYRNNYFLPGKNVNIIDNFLFDFVTYLQNNVTFQCDYNIDDIYCMQMNS